MSVWLDEPRNRRDGVTIPTIWVAVALSILIHAAALWKLPRVHLTSSEFAEHQDMHGPLTVQLAPQARSRPASPPSPEFRAQRPLPEHAPKAAPRPRPTPPESALNLALNTAPNTAPSEDPNARANRIAAANLGLDRKPTFGPKPAPGGGVFGIQRMTYDYAEFAFYGWNKDIRRNTTQVIEVRKGTNSDIRIAVVRRMISIIRDYEEGDFVWESQRLGRSLTLSARAKDNAGLEDFLMREFFEEYRRQ